jgi:hypothetical protein
MPAPEIEVTLLLENDEKAKGFLKELEQANAAPEVSQVNFAGGLAEYVVFCFHWTPLLIESFRAMLHKHKPKKLELKVEGKLNVTIESEGFDDVATMKLVELVLTQR